MTYQFSIFSLLLKFLFAIFFSYCFWGYFYSPHTPDIEQYMFDFTMQNGSYEWAYNRYVHFIYNYVSTDFFWFWFSLYAIQLISLLLIYKDKWLFIFALPILIYSISMFSYQIRYALFCLYFVYFFVSSRRSIYNVFSVLIHKTAILPLSLIFISRYVSIRFDRFYVRNIHSLVLFFVFVGFDFISQAIFFSAAQTLGLDYFLLYADKDNYLASKSIVSTLVIYVTLLILLDGLRHVKPDKLSYFLITLFYVMVGFNSTAIISERLFKLAILFLPFTMNSFMQQKETRPHSVALFTIMSLSAFFKIYKYGLFQ